MKETELIHKFKRQAMELEQLRAQVKHILGRLEGLNAKIDALKPKGSEGTDAVGTQVDSDRLDTAR